jgi:biopolymer transport protein ExbD
MEIYELEENLKQRANGGAELHVIIRGDAEGAFQNVANVLSVCRRAGVNDLGISVRMASRE